LFRKRRTVLGLRMTTWQWLVLILLAVISVAGLGVFMLSSYIEALRKAEQGWKDGITR
jgi:hypothetical protein